MERINIDSWERGELYRFYQQSSHPFYSVCFRQDVTGLYTRCKENGWPVYLTMIHEVTRAVNGLKAFRYGYENGSVVLYDHRDPSFTDMPKGSSQFRILTVPWHRDADVWRARALEKREKQTVFLDESAEGANLIFISCLPWLDLTGMTNERNFDRNDAVPRISWGKFVRDGNRLVCGMAVEVHHGYIDGKDIGELHGILEERTGRISE